MTTPRPRPRLDSDNRAFWTGGAEGKLNLMKCGDCGEFTHPPRQICRHCQSENMAPEAMPGTGVIDTYTVNHQAWVPGLDEKFVFAAVELEEQAELYVFTNILAPPNQVRSGLPVKVCFEHHEDVWLPMFELAGGANAS